MDDRTLYAVGFLTPAEDPGPHELLTRPDKKMPNMHMVYGPVPDFEEAKLHGEDDKGRHFYILKARHDDRCFRPIRRYHKGKWHKLEDFKG
jgi:hypothetical protein